MEEYFKSVVSENMEAKQIDDAKVYSLQSLTSLEFLRRDLESQNFSRAEEELISLRYKLLQLTSVLNGQSYILPIREK